MGTRGQIISDPRSIALVYLALCQNLWVNPGGIPLVAFDGQEDGQDWPAAHLLGQPRPPCPQNAAGADMKANGDGGNGGQEGGDEIDFIDLIDRPAESTLSTLSILST